MTTTATPRDALTQNVADLLRAHRASSTDRGHNAGARAAHPRLPLTPVATPERSHHRAHFAVIGGGRHRVFYRRSN